MRMRPDYISQEGTAGVLDGIAATEESLMMVGTPYRWIANGFSYVFSAAFVFVFLALGIAASVTVVTIVAGIFGAFN